MYYENKFNIVVPQGSLYFSDEILLYSSTVRVLRI